MCISPLKTNENDNLPTSGIKKTTKNERKKKRAYDPFEISLAKKNKLMEWGRKNNHLSDLEMKRFSSLAIFLF